MKSRRFKRFVAAATRRSDKRDRLLDDCARLQTSGEAAGGSAHDAHEKYECGTASSSTAAIFVVCTHKLGFRCS